MNKLLFGDNLDMLREHVKDESVHIAYLDPPFNSNANYNVLFKGDAGIPSEAQAEAFRDTWGWGEAAALSFEETMRGGDDLALLLRSFRSWLGDKDSMMAYLAMMAIRLKELRRVLSQNGSLYIHCDPTASHYLKLLLDAIFGRQNFRSEIIWRRSSSHNKLTKQFGPIHDTVLFYSRSDKPKFHPGRTPYSRSYVSKMFRFKDDNGAYRSNELTGTGTRKGDSGEPWKGYNPTEKGRHWAIPASLREYLPDNGKGMITQQMLDELAALDLIVFSPGGRPTYKQRLGAGVPYQDIWAYQPGTERTLAGTDDGIDRDVKWLDDEDEREGYPTQKPVGLLSRIIETSSDPGDVILDPFCGCGTTVEAAEKAKRQWIGIDVTHYAITLIESRLWRKYSDAKFEVHGRPTDLAGAQELARRDKYQFQWWAAWRLGAQTYETKKGGDRGIDGNIYFANGPYGYGRIIISVKGGEYLNPGMVRDLSGVLEREDDALMGILVTLEEPTKGMKTEAASAGFVRQSVHGSLPRIQIVTAADLIDGHMPKMPPLPHPIRQIGRTHAAKQRDQLELLFPFEGEGPFNQKGQFIDPRFMKVG